MKHGGSEGFYLRLKNYRSIDKAFPIPIPHVILIIFVLYNIICSLNEFLR